MEESLTQGTPQAAASQEPTATPVETPKADVHNQETISGEQSQEAVSTTPAETNPSGDVETDDGLAKFAKGQGYTDEDIAGMSEREKKTLLSLKKSADAHRNPDKKLTDANDLVDAPKQGATEDDEFKREFRQYKYERQVDSFWAGDGGRDRALEPVMAEILNEKVAELTPILGEQAARQHAFNLSRDLGTLYSMAQIKSGTFDPNAAKEEGRREERDSIRQQSSASAPQAHAVTPGTPSTPKVDREWLTNTYDPTNEEHKTLLAEAMARGDLY